MIMPQLYITAESLVPSASFLPKSKAHWIKQSIRLVFMARNLVLGVWTQIIHA